jgi:CheY-like chemotaxis protein
MFLILVLDDEPDVESLFRQHFRRELRAGRFAMNFAQSAPAALQREALFPKPIDFARLRSEIEMRVGKVT